MTSLMDPWESLWEQTQRSVHRYIRDMGFSPDSYEYCIIHDEEEERSIIQFRIRGDEGLIAQIALEMMEDVPTIVVQTFDVPELFERQWNGAVSG